MPVNFWPILLPLILIFLGCTWVVYRRAPKVAYAILTITLLSITFVYLNLNVEKTRTRNMSWKIYESSIGSTGVELTDSAGDPFQTYLASRKLAEHLKSSGKQAIPVELVEWRDFGSLRGYRIEKIDGINVANWISDSRP